MESLTDFEHELWKMSYQDSFFTAGEERKYYNYIKTKVIDLTFPKLNDNEKEILTAILLNSLNLLFTKFMNNNPDMKTIFWNQMTQNNNLDLRALLNLTLPFVISDGDYDRKQDLVNLSELYTKKDDDDKYYFTNSQYNRCIRYMDKGEVKIVERKYHHDYYFNHMRMLAMSIDSIANKLYVNWVDVLPVSMLRYKNTHCYKMTQKKFMLLNGYKERLREAGRNLNIREYYSENKWYFEELPGLSLCDFYNVFSNYLFHDIKNIKWLIYDIDSQGGKYPVIHYLRKKFNITHFIDGKNWGNLDRGDRITFQKTWNELVKSGSKTDIDVISYIYYFLQKYYSKKDKLQRKGEIEFITYDNEDDDIGDENEYVRREYNTEKIIEKSKEFAPKIKIENVYEFLLEQFTKFKKTWYYYKSVIKAEYFLDNTETTTLKNVYNFAKSIVHEKIYHNNAKEGIFYQYPKHWCTLDTVQRNNFIQMIIPGNNYDYILSRFRISIYLRTTYGIYDKESIIEKTKNISENIISNMIDVVFENLVYNGLLSEFIPCPEITDNEKIESAANTTDENLKTKYKQKMISSKIFTPEKRRDYENAYYFLTGAKYGDLKMMELQQGTKKYFDFLGSDQIWTFTYAMNWISQINFYHHYINCRVLYITGATGVGKSTQVPKLLMYSQKMIDFNKDGKIICSQPRIPPTVENAQTISRELGVPITKYSKQYDRDIPTNNYNVQFKHGLDSHISLNETSFLKIVTDGTLYNHITNFPMLTKTEKQNVFIKGKKTTIQKYYDKNEFDTVIVDEAHEHNLNMDLILTLMRDVAYINNSIKLVIVSATMDDDEPIYRRYYRSINDNRAYPLNKIIEDTLIDRANIDRRIHISPPGKTTQYVIKDVYLPIEESEKINETNFVDYGIKKTIDVINNTQSGDILLFLSGVSEIEKAVTEINKNSPYNVICLPYYGKLTEEERSFIQKIHQTLKNYDRHKDDVLLEEKDVKRRTSKGTYERAVIVATNVAEASITLQNLKYVIDTGYANVDIYDPVTKIRSLKKLPISNSSSLQRRGRVGRVSSGTVYYNYHRDKVRFNKTSYKIAESDITDSVMNLVKSEHWDLPLITPYNDFNNVNRVISYQNEVYQNSRIYYENPNDERLTRKIFSEENSKIFFHKVFLYVEPFKQFILSKYFRSPNFNRIDNFYSYIGMNSDPPDISYGFNTIKSVKILEEDKYQEYMHDDYDFQYMFTYCNFYSRGYTGYELDILLDNSLSFYLIHPDENMIKRNPFTGRFENFIDTEIINKEYVKRTLIRCGETVPDNIDTEEITFKKILGDRKPKMLNLPKPSILFDDSQIIGKCYSTKMSYSNDFPDSKDPFIKKYQKIYKKIQQDLLSKTFSGYGITQTKILETVNKIKNALDVKNYDFQKMCWYIYCMNFSLANEAMIMIETLSSITSEDVFSIFNEQFKKKNRWNFLRQIFYSKKYTSDIEFLYDYAIKIMTIIEEFYVKMNDIEISVRHYFDEIKYKYQNSQTLDFNDYKILKKLDNEGLLSSEHVFYHFIKLYRVHVDYEEIAKIIYSDIYTHYNKDFLFEVCQKTIDKMLLTSRNKWIYEYEIKNDLMDEPEINIFDESSNIKPPIHIDSTDLDKIRMSYISSHAGNLAIHAKHSKKFGDTIIQFKDKFEIKIREFDNKNESNKKTLIDTSPNIFIYDYIRYLDAYKVGWITSIKDIHQLYELNPLLIRNIKSMKNTDNFKKNEYYQEYKEYFDKILDDFEPKYLDNFMTMWKEYELLEMMK